MAKKTSSLIPAERIERAILFLRGQKVMLDADLASLYGVDTGQLVRAVKRNLDRFPGDFAFQLTRKELTNLKCQIGISSSGWGGRRTLPWAFTEQGVAMLSSVLRSPQAAVVNIEIMRAFVRLREMIGTHADLARRLDELERRFREHDEQFVVVFDAIRQLMTPIANETYRDAIELAEETAWDRLTGVVVDRAFNGVRRLRFCRGKYGGPRKSTRRIGRTVLARPTLGPTAPAAACAGGRCPRCTVAASPRAPTACHVCRERSRQ